MATIDSINGYYTTVLNRTASPTEAAGWANLVDTGAVSLPQALADIANSFEALNDVAPIVAMYQADLGRVPDQAGLRAWVTEEDSGTLTMAQISAAIAGSAEAQAYSQTHYLVGLDDPATSDSVTLMYTTILGRNPEAGAVAAWLNTGLTEGEIQQSIAASPEARVIAAPEVTAFFTKAGNDDPTVYTGSLSGGATFALTTGADVITPTQNNTGASFPSAGNDTFTGTVAPTGSTLNSGDDLDGGGGANTLVISDTAGTDTNDLAGVTLANIQTVSVENASAGTVTADFAPAPTVSKIIALNTAAGQTDDFTNLATGAQVIASGADTGAGSVVNISMATSTDPVSMGVDGGVSGLNFNNDTGTEAAATISSTGGSNGTTEAPDAFGVAGGSGNVATLTLNAATNLVATLFNSDYVPNAALTVSGAATSVDLLSNPVESGFATIDASGLTSGGLTIETGPQLTSLIGGAGNDVITLGGDTTNATITGGAGGMDTFAGGGGNNTFGFMAAPGAGNLTTISAFTSGSDALALSKTAFSALTEDAGNALNTSDFLPAATAADLPGGSVAGTTTPDAIVYLQDTGALYYNTDGATAGGLTQIGALGANTTLALGDIKVTA